MDGAMQQAPQPGRQSMNKEGLGPDETGTSQSRSPPSFPGTRPRFYFDCPRARGPIQPEVTRRFAATQPITPIHARLRLGGPDGRDADGIMTGIDDFLLLRVVDRDLKPGLRRSGRLGFRNTNLRNADFLSHAVE